MCTVIYVCVVGNFKKSLKGKKFCVLIESFAKFTNCFHYVSIHNKFIFVVTIKLYKVFPLKLFLHMIYALYSVAIETVYSTLCPLFGVTREACLCTGQRSQGQRGDAQSNGHLPCQGEERFSAAFEDSHGSMDSRYE